MNLELPKILTESLELELNVAELYLLFSYLFPEDNYFWWKLAIEEKNHAALLRSGQQYFIDANLFPEEILSSKLDNLIKTNQKIINLISKFEIDPPSRITALQVALELEQSVGEFHFQAAMEVLPQSKALKVFQHLNRDDRDHAIRIQTYKQTKGL